MSAQRQPRIRRDAWEAERENIRRLYIDEGKTLEGENGIIATMQSKYSFRASKAQYETQFKKWGFRKNATKTDWMTLFRVLENEYADEDGLTVYLYGELVAPKKLEKQRSTYKGKDAMDSNLQAPSLPACFRIESTVRHEPPTQDTVPVEACTSNDSIRSMQLHGGRRSTSPSFPQSPAIENFFFDTNLGDAFGMLSPSGSFLMSHYFPEYFNHEYTMQEIGPASQPSFNTINGRHDMRPMHSTSSAEALPYTFSISTDCSSLFPMLTKLCSALPQEINLMCSRSIQHFKVPFQILLTPSTQDLISTQIPSAQVLYFVVHALVNKLVDLTRLSFPEDDSDEVFRRFILYFNSLSPARLGTILDSFPDSLRKALEEGVFCASVALGAHHTMKLLLARGVDANSIRLWNQTLNMDRPLLHAILQNYVDAAAVLLESHVSIEWTTYRNVLRKKQGLSPEMMMILVQADHRFIRLLKQAIRNTKNKDLLSVCLRCILQSRDLFLENVYVIEHFAFIEDDLIIESVLQSIPNDWFQEFIHNDAEKQRENGRPTRTERLLATFISRHNHESTQFLLEKGVRPSPYCLIAAIKAENICVTLRILDERISPFQGCYNGYPIETALFTQSSEIRALFSRRGYFKELIKHKFVLTKCIGRAFGENNARLLGEVLELYYSQKNKMLDPECFSFNITRFDSSRHHDLKKLLDQTFKREIFFSPSLLSAALLVNDLHLVEVMLDYIHDPFQIQGFQVLHIAVFADSLHMMQCLLDSGASIHEYGWPPTEIEDGRIEDPDFVPGDLAYQLMASAILHGNQAIIERLFEMAIPLNYDWNGSDGLTGPAERVVTPLKAAVYTGDLDLVRTLLRKGASPYDPYELYGRAFQHRGIFDLACSMKQLDTMKMFLDTDPRNNAERQALERNILLSAVRTGDANFFDDIIQYRSERTVKKYLAGTRGVNAKFTHFQQESLNIGLVYAVTSEAKDSLRMTKSLLNCGADAEFVVSPRDFYVKNFESCASVLILAVVKNDIFKVQELVEAGANVHLQAKRGVLKTAIQQAASNGAIHIVEFLLRIGKPDEPPAHRRGLTAVQSAAAKGYVGIISLLIQRGASVNEPRCAIEGRTAFEAAAEFGRIDTLNFLVEKGLDLVSDGGEQRKNAIWLAKGKGHHAVAEAVEELYQKACQKAGSRMMMSDMEYPFPL